MIAVFGRFLLFIFLLAIVLYIAGYFIYRWIIPMFKAGKRVEKRHYHDWLMSWKKVK